MAISTYAVENEIDDFLEHKEVPVLDESIYLELAPEFNDYQDSYFIYSLPQSIENPSVYDVDLGIKQIEYVEDEKLGLSLDQIESEIKEFSKKNFADFKKNLRAVSLSWEYQISPDLKTVKILSEKPEGDLMWSSSTAEEFMKFIEETVDLSTTDSLESLNLEELWTRFEPQTRWYLYAWIRDPQDALSSILEQINEYLDRMDPDQLAYDIYTKYKGDRK